MPVRPITDAEYKIAAGEPVTSWLVLFGASQGFLTHLRLNGISVRAKTLLPTPFAKVTLPALVIGGAAVGGFLGFLLFGDQQLRRLRISHQIDRITRTDAQNYVPKELL